ncbi:hypothetical protein M3P21_10465 [Ruegeria sp. 2012CJ41-6]|uniref:Dihydroorotate dehydrogenase n=1 Tax=Ruegeria spongiae TaxID=2942209 RepID=A0ABT0Q2C5_9RHOB|nr:hypothetical protein [Ruegeria spongiae]MCL6283953.1 hypothetical protein [Ruegeria spongiae]
MTETDKDLEALFAAARETRDDMPAGLAARMTADADRIQQDHLAPAEPVRSRPGLWHQVQSLLGGWAGMGGLVAASAAGVWIGLAPPEFLPDPAGLVFQQEEDLELFQSFAFNDVTLEEG